MSKRNFGRLQFSQLLITTAIVHALIYMSVGDSVEILPTAK
jgi:hypothetical protein